MKTTARNRFEGTVAGIRPGAITDEIDLEIAEGVHVVATVTGGSRETLGLTMGLRAFALVKASWIIVATETRGVQLSARNQLPGKVLRMRPGAIDTEVVLRVVGGIEVVAIVTNDSALQLALGPGSTAIAVFKASSVVIGVYA